MADTDDVFVLYDSREERSQDCVCIGVEKKGKDPLNGKRARKSKKTSPATLSAGESGAIVVVLDELEEDTACMSVTRPSCSRRSGHLASGTVATDSRPGNCSVRPTSPMIVESDSTSESKSSRVGEKLTRTSQGANDQQLPLNYTSNSFGESDEDSTMDVDVPLPKRRNTCTDCKLYLQNFMGSGGTCSLLTDKDSTLQDHDDEDMALPLPRDGFVDADYKLALELNKQLNYSASKPVQLPSKSPDAELARQLQEEEYSQRGTSTSSCQLALDEEFARKLQEEEDVQFVKAVQGTSPKKARRMLNEGFAMDEDSSVQIVKSTKVAISSLSQTGPSSQSVGTSSSNISTSLPTTATDVPMPFSSSLESDGATSGTAAESLPRLPSTWTICPKCHPDAVRKYHLIDVLPETEEWSRVASPLTSAGFVVKRVQRIQNSSLWQRLQYEKQLLVQDRPMGFDLNEKILYHTSRAEKAVICEEGLDQRLSRNGNFGTGIYFSDDPIKCDQYWHGRDPRRMFACRVLLGESKEYTRGSVDPNLRREPPKVAPKPGEHKTYDSVLGNISGQNEYVVYNAYRVVPEYVMEYSQHHDGRSVHLHRALSQYKARAAVKAQRRNTLLQAAAALQTPSLPSYNFAVPPTVTSTTNLAAPVTPAVDEGACYLCTKDPTTCKCGLTSRKLCKHCKKKPSSCTCPFFTTASSKEIPYRCLTPLLQRWVLLRESKLAVGRMQSSGVSRGHQPKTSKK